jgi:hypothetical protein
MEVKVHQPGDEGNGKVVTGGDPCRRLGQEEEAHEGVAAVGQHESGERTVEGGLRPQIPQRLATIAYCTQTHACISD